MPKLSKAQRSLVSLVTVGGMSPRYITRERAADRGLLDDFNRCRRAGLIRSAGYETTGKGDEWLDSPAGRAALEEQNDDR